VARQLLNESQFLSTEKLRFIIAKYLTLDRVVGRKISLNTSSFYSMKKVLGSTVTFAISLSHLSVVKRVQ
jgi:hypothetical protein